MGIESCKKIVLEWSKNEIKTNKAKDYKNRSLLLFIDFKSAYDRMSREKIYSRLLERNILEL